MAATPKLTGTSSTGEAQTSLPLTDATPLEQNCDVPASGPIDLPIEVGNTLGLTRGLGLLRNEIRIGPR